MILPFQNANPQGGWEISAHAIGATAPGASLVAGPGIAWLPARRDRVALRTGVGIADGGRAVGRAEAVWQVRLAPGSPRPAPYAGAGVGVVRTDSTRGVVIVLIGVEGAPGARGTWLLEAGVGGGVRVLVGYRRRW